MDLVAVDVHDTRDPGQLSPTHFDQLKAAGSTTYDYDALDRLIQRNSTALTYSGSVGGQIGRAVCEAFAEALGGVPAEVLTDNGKQVTGRFTKPVPAEVLFERMCRENGISQRLTKRCSPTTTGKIERWHRTLREELLDQVAPFESFSAAQEAITDRR
jgi:transposase InsO family protein